MNCTKTIAITVVGNTLVLTIPGQQLKNGEKFKICLNQDIPPFFGILEVGIETGNGIYPIITRNVPNYLYTDQLKHCHNNKLKNKQCIDVTFATDTGFFLYQGSPLNCTKYNMPAIPILASINGSEKTVAK